MPDTDSNGDPDDRVIAVLEKRDRPDKNVTDTAPPLDVEVMYFKRISPNDLQRLRNRGS